MEKFGEFVWSKRYFLLFGFLLFAFSGNAQNSRILIDGIFEDWNQGDIIITDPTGDNGTSNIDFRRIWIGNDDQYLFISMEIGEENLLQEGNSIEIFIDTDNNPATGSQIHDLGADLRFNFGSRSGSVFVNGNSLTVNHADLELISAPTVSSERFEFSISRNLNFSGSNLFKGDKIKLFFRTEGGFGDVISNGNVGVPYQFSSQTIGLLPNYSIQKIQPEHLRIMSYNVLRDGIFQASKTEHFRRIFQATRPDIIGFQEIYDADSTELKLKMESFLPSGPGQKWYSWKVDPDIFLVSRFPILKVSTIKGSSSSSSGNGSFLVDLGNFWESQIQIIVAHLPCCENDEQRQSEVDAIMGHLRETKESLPSGTPIVILGDMNFVGSSTQLHSFLSGDISGENIHGPDFAPDWDETDFENSVAYNNDSPFAYTWYSEGSSFFPGKLDFILYSGSVLEQANGFVLNTRTLLADTLNAYNFQRNNVLTASDHAPIVADFKFISTSSTNVLEKNFPLKIYPNPSRERLFFEMDGLISQNFSTWEILDLNGRINSFGKFPLAGSWNNIGEISLEGFPGGFYFLKLVGEKVMLSAKFIKL